MHVDTSGEGISGALRRLLPVVGARPRRLVFLAALGLSVAGCSPTVIRHGHQFQDNDIQQIQAGMSQAQVTGVLGSPTTTATVNGAQTLYYIASTEQRNGFLPAEETDRKVLAIYFTPLGSVERVSQYGLKDGKVVNFSSNQTPNSARDENIIRQLFRKLGTKQLFGNEQ